MSRLRVAERVAHGGHSIPAADIARRFPRSLWNLLELYACAVDDARCFVNSGPAPGIVFTQQGNQRTILDPAVFDPLVKAAKPSTSCPTEMSTRWMHCVAR